MDKVKVVLYGVGAMGSLLAKFLLQKEGVAVVGAIDSSEEKAGRDLGEVLNIGSHVGVTVSNRAEAVLSKTKPNIVVHATSSTLKEVFPQLTEVVAQGIDVVSTCEELSYPYNTQPQLASKLDVLAKKHEVTVLGTGINPGFLMDTLVITLTAVCQKIEKIKVVRVINAATRRLSFQKKIGAGLSKEDFREAFKKRLISGHVGLEQSILMIGAALAWKFDSVEVGPVEAVIAEKPVRSKEVFVGSGFVSGLKQVARGIRLGRPLITLEFKAYLGAEEEYDSITIQGIPNVNQKIKPCVHGDTGTVALVVNAIPKVINSPPGLVTMKDLTVPSAATENMLSFIRQGPEATL